MKKILQDKIWSQVLQKFDTAIKSKSPTDIESIKNYFSMGRKCQVSTVQNKYVPRINPSCIQYRQQGQHGYVLNPFQAKSHNMVLDLLTDSGTSTLTDEQIKFKQWYCHSMPAIQINAYAGLTPKLHLNNIIKQIFGQQFNFYLTVQGRAAQKLLLNALTASHALKQNEVILSNRPFDTTKGQILKKKLVVEALTPVANPQTYVNSQTVFMGNLTQQSLSKYTKQMFNAVLLTLTDNGSGGQPVSMANVKQCAQFAKKNNKLFWVDACRIFQNATFIKTFEKGYQNHTIKDIVNQISSYADVMTISFKKIYSHGGGGILLNKNSKVLADKLNLIDKHIKQLTTADYGNGFDSYSGITGEVILQIITGLLCGVTQGVVGRRIAQVAEVGLTLRQQYNLPIIAGGHALYIAADKILQNVELHHCPAQYLNAILMNALQVRGCGLGYIVYGKRKDGKILVKDLSMDSLRLAIPRQTYSTQELTTSLSILGQAHKQGLFKNMKGGLIPIDHVDDGFYHFGANYDLADKKQFEQVVNKIIKMRT